MAKDFQLTAQEQQLVDKAAKGEWWSPEPAGDEIQLDLDPAYAYGWHENRTIRADIIRRLAAGAILAGEEKVRPVSTKGLRIVGARISGPLDLEGAKLDQALRLHACAFDDSVALTDARAKTVSFTASYFPFGIKASRVLVRGNFLLDDGFRATREVNLMGATITGQLACSRGSFDNPSGMAINGSSVTVGAAIFLSRGFSASGEVRLRGVRIEQSLDCHGGSFNNPGADALDCSSMKVGADVFLSEGFTARGQVDLRGAKIEGQLACDGGSFDSHRGGLALVSDNIVVGADAFFRDGFSARGEVNFVRATIKGNLRCERAAFSNKGGNAIDLTLANIGAGLFIRKLKPTKGSIRGLEGGLALEQAQCRTYSDDCQSWPEAGKLVLDGFTYERFHACATDCATRRDWLKLQRPEHLSESFRPQPWMQAVQVLREMGHEDDARDLAVEREIARHDAERNPARKAWLAMLHITVGSGYKPWKALYWSLAFFFVGWFTFWSANALGYMAPRDGSVIAYLSANPGKPVPPRYTEFNSFLYAADAFLPVIELGQDLAWEPTTVRDPTARPLPTDLSAASRVIRWSAATFATGWHRVVYWAEEVLGWIFVSLFIAGMSGIMKKE